MKRISVHSSGREIGCMIQMVLLPPLEPPLLEMLAEKAIYTVFLSATQILLETE